MENIRLKNILGILLSIIILAGNLTLMGCKGKDLNVLDITDKTPHQIGTFESNPEGNIMHSSKGQSGFLVFGPYWPLKKGLYRVKFNLMGVGEPDQEVARIDVNIMDTTVRRPITSPVERRIISSGKTEWQEYEIYFQAGDNEKGSLVYEFRVYANGAGDVKVRRISLERL